MLQLAPTASVAGHPWVIWYTGAALSVTLEMPAAETPGFETVTVIDTPPPPASTFPKFSAVGDTATSVPIPLRCTLFAAAPEKLKVTDPVRGPGAVGAKVTLAVQFCPAGSVPGQVFVWEKPPLGAMPVNVSGAVPMLFSVTLWEALAVPTTVSLYDKLAVEMVGSGVG